jgi:hypothetical protein
MIENSGVLVFLSYDKSMKPPMRCLAPEANKAPQSRHASPKHPNLAVADSFVAIGVASLIEL